jgi:hypothetical protein
MVLLLMNNGFGKFDEILEWELSKYLTLGEMLVRRQTIENIK